jgi:hypothetical protein
VSIAGRGSTEHLRNTNLESYNYTNLLGAVLYTGKYSANIRISI